MADTNIDGIATQRTLAGAEKIPVGDAAGDGVQRYTTPNALQTFFASTQAEQEAGSSTAKFVTPGRQHFHPCAAKCWAIVTGGGTPVLSLGYNITSITDTAAGQLTITIATDFSSANWACLATVERASTALTVANTATCAIRSGGRAAGTVLLECWDDTATTHVAEDPTSWAMVGYGDHA